MSKSRMTAYLMPAMLLGLASGCVTQPYRPATIVSSERSYRQIEPADITQPIKATAPNVFYKDINKTSADGTVLSEDSKFLAFQDRTSTIKAGTILIRIMFDGQAYYCTTNAQSIFGSTEIYGCFFDEDQDGKFEGVHSFAGNPRREKGSKRVYFLRLQEPLEYQPQEVVVDTGPNTWTLSYIGITGDLARIDHVISTSSGPDGREWYRRSYFIPLSDIGKPWSGLSIPYVPYSGTWLAPDRAAVGSLNIVPLTATPTELTLRITKTWPAAQILKLPNVPGQYRTVPYRSKLSPGD